MRAAALGHSVKNALRALVGTETFFASGEETDSFRGVTQTSDFTDLDTGYSAVPGHYSTSEILGFNGIGEHF